MRREKTSDFRKFSIQGFSLVEGGHNFMGLLEFDVTRPRRRLRDMRQQGQDGSLLAFLLKALGQAIADNPGLNSFVAYRKISHFDDVDINIPVEVHLDGGVENRQLIIRDIVHKSLAEITAEIARVKEEKQSASWFTRPSLGRRLLCLLPRFLLQMVFRSFLNSHRLIRELSGTVFVSSVSSVSTVPGFIVPYIGGPKAVSVAFGSVFKKPLVVRDRIEIREVISVSAVFNHDIVDGAPAARFINSFRRYVEQDWQNVISAPSHEEKELK